ncbi:MAG: peptide ABC transporter substrate-binding protein [Dehalococcoidia bacterium]|nr:peptide ABC transporter substrate-binding protein [Dehalococcoidia bacterium]
MSNRTLALLMGVVAFLILVVGIVFVAALAGGGGDDGGGTPASPDRRPNTSGDICKGNTLITYGDDPATVLDPIQVRDDNTAQYVLEIFDGLVTLGLDLKVQPDIAKSWAISPDGKTYTFHLRDDVVFHDGSRRVTAADFKYSIERAADPKNGSPTVTLYLGNIVGLKDRFNNKANDVAGVKVINDTTVEIDLVQPAEFFLAELTYPVAFVVDKNQIERDPRNWTRHPNGTGPFKLTTYTPGQTILLTRNDRYHLGAAKLDAVDFELGGGSIVTRYENNELHISVVPPIELGDVKSGKSPLAKDYHPQPEMAINYMAFNIHQAPFDDVNVRRAMAMAVDRDNINKVLLFDSQRVADGILPPEMPGYSASVHALKFDVAAAKAALAQSKYAGNMPRIILTYPGSGGDAPDTLAAFQAAWKDNLGLDVQLQALDYAAYLRELRKGTFQMFAAGWIADYPDPENFLDKLFASDSVQNEQGYKDDQVDQWLQQARTGRDPAERYRLYNQVEQKILDDAVMMPTFWPVAHTLVKPCVKGWPQVALSVPKYRFISIEADTK